MWNRYIPRSLHPPSMSREETVTVSCGGHEFTLQLTRSYTTVQLGRTFGVDPIGIWLQQTYGNQALFPANEGTFDLGSEGIQPFSDLTVEGEGSGSGNRTTAPSVTLSATAGGSSSPAQPSYPGFRPVLSTQRRRGLYGGGFNLKVIQAEMTVAISRSSTFPKVRTNVHNFVRVDYKHAPRNDDREGRVGRRVHLGDRRRPRSVRFHRNSGYVQLWL